MGGGRRGDKHRGPLWGIFVFAHRRLSVPHRTKSFYGSKRTEKHKIAAIAAT